MILIALLFVSIKSDSIDNETDPIPEFFVKELEKIDQLENSLSNALDLVYKLVKFNETKYTKSSIDKYEQLLEDLNKQADHIVNTARPYPDTKLYQVPLTIATVEVLPQTGNSEEKRQSGNSNVDIPLYFVLGEKAKFVFEPAYKVGNDAHGIIFRKSSNSSCEAKQLKFTFYSNEQKISKQKIDFQRKNVDTNVNVNNVLNFDKLVVKAAAKFENVPQLCLPAFSVYTLRHDQE